MSFKRLIGRILCIFAMLLCCIPVFALADDAGVMTETELGNWVAQVLLQSKAESPQNIPVGEESLTDSGYAFLYSFATLYYDKPVLDNQSILQGFAITDENLVTPRGISLGSSAWDLIAAYGWQNPELLGDGSFAALYRLNNLPSSAKWSWAQRSDTGIVSVRCAVHADVGDENRYTDAGILYQTQDGLVSAIHVYGLNQSISLADVQSNLSAIAAVQAAASGDSEREAASYLTPSRWSFLKSEAPAFGEADLSFAGIHFLELAEADASLSLGPPDRDEWLPDDTGEWLHIAHRDGLVLTYLLDKNRENSRLETLCITSSRWEGPRGVHIQDSTDSVLSRFLADGAGSVLGEETLLYGNGTSPPYGAIFISDGWMTARYVALIQGADGIERETALCLSFADDQLVEILLYSW